jgi:hypothetical protein
MLVASGNDVKGTSVLVRSNAFTCAGVCKVGCAGGPECRGWHAPANGNKAVVRTDRYSGRRMWHLKWRDGASMPQTLVKWPRVPTYKPGQVIKTTSRTWGVRQA